jgi:hypothetical protein
LITAGLGAVLLCVLSGLGPARLLDRGARGGLLVAESFLAGSGVLAAILVLESALGLPWSLTALILPVAVLGIWGLLLLPSPSFKVTRIGVFGALLQGGAVLWHAAYATRADLYDWGQWLISRRDFFFIWGYKAKLFFTVQGIPWSFLGALPNDFSHPDYPLLVPLQFALPSILAGAWQPRGIGIVDTAFATAALIIAHRCLREELSPLVAAVGALSLAGCVLLPWPGFAEGPLVAYSASAVLLLRSRRLEALPLAGALLALAAMSKNEGIAFVAATAVALLIADRQRLRVLITPAIVIVFWMLLRWNLHTDLFTPGLLSRVAHNLQLFPKAFANIGAYQPFAWAGALGALALAPGENVRRERFLLTIVALQLALYLGAYAVTPLEVVGHVNGSWDRISSHVTMLVAFAGVTSAGKALQR